MPNKATHIGYITQDKVTLLDLKSKKIIRSIPKWGGICTKDGKYGLYAPSRFVPNYYLLIYFNLNSSDLNFFFMCF